MTERLEPCPFCGNTDIKVEAAHFDKFGEERTWVSCWGDDCEMIPQTAAYADRADAIAAWNKRAS